MYNCICMGRRGEWVFKLLKKCVKASITCQVPCRQPRIVSKDWNLCAEETQHMQNPSVLWRQYDARSKFSQVDIMGYPTEPYYPYPYYLTDASYYSDTASMQRCVWDPKLSIHHTWNVFLGSTTSVNLAFEHAAINLRHFFGNPLKLRWLHICDILIRFHILEASISLVVVRYVVLGAIKHWHLYVNPQWAPGQSYGRYCHKYSHIVTNCSDSRRVETCISHMKKMAE